MSTASLAPPGLRVVIAGGGTGGHLFPGLALAHELTRRVPGAEVSFAGTARGIEARVVPSGPFALDLIRSAGLKGKSIAALARGVSLLPLSALDAWRVVSRRQPHVVVGVGGYSSGPLVLAAALRGVPTLVLEQNAIPGLANRLLARLVDAAALTYEEARPWFGDKAFISGNPVRPGFLAGPAASTTAEPGSNRPPRLLVFGGSQGAHAINVAMVAAATRFRAMDPLPAITHQTGERDLAEVRDGYARAGLTARAEPFLHEMDREMSEADVVVCRAGATTLAELTVAGKPAVLVPLPTATDDHQRKNADALARAGAALVIDQGSLTGDTLFDAVAALLSDPARRTAMSRAAHALGHPDAARLIADRVIALATASRERRP